MPSHLDAFHYDLPLEYIAQIPADSRDSSRLLVIDDEIKNKKFADICDEIPADSVVVVNDTKVFPARLFAQKNTGGKVEVLLLSPSLDSEDNFVWDALVSRSKSLKDGMCLQVCHRGHDAIDDAPMLVIKRSSSEQGITQVRLPMSVEQLCKTWGEVPLPPYIKRNDGATVMDEERYQTVYSSHIGSVAAPTAGIHFTDEIFAKLRARGVQIVSITLHIGAGTFLPVRDNDLDNHKMHQERFCITKDVSEIISSAKHVVATGTTVVRALETAAKNNNQIDYGHGVTDLFIRPGYKFRVVDSLITNFHLPESTLLMLVCAFGGYDRVMSAYRYAVAQRYRFYSYGDAMFLSKNNEVVS